MIQPASQPPGRESNRPLDHLDRWILGLLIVSSLLLVLPGLGRNHLWNDEAHTAVLGRNILLTGLPLASDGRNLLTFANDHRDIRDGVYIWQPWLPAYLTAASMSVFGANTLGARIPFAMSFVLLIAASYRSFRRWHPDRQVAVIGAVSMLGCVPLLTHARQCRYYLLTPLFGLLAVNSYLRIHEKPNARATASLTLWFTLLFNAFYPAAFILAVALAIDVSIRRPTKAALLSFVYAASAFLLINAPIAIYCTIWDREFGIQPGYSDMGVFGLYLLRYLLTINTFFFPFALLAFAAIWRWRDWHRAVDWRNDRLRLLAILCATTLIGFGLLSDFPFTRYLLGMVPFMFFLCVSALWVLSGQRPLVVWSLMFVVLTSNLLEVLPLQLLRATSFQQAQWTLAGVDPRFLQGGEGKAFGRGEIKAILNTELGSPLMRYLGTFARPPKGPIDHIVEYLDEHASKDDRVTIAYGDVSLMFHTDLFVTGSLTGKSPPKWVINRHFNPLRASPEFVRARKQFRYVPIELEVADVQWNNRPDPVYHRFEPFPLDTVPAVKILRRSK
jgi:hypothetical protein